jgi:hypothetical protein
MGTGEKKSEVIFMALSHCAPPPMSIALQRAQAIAILQQDAALGQGSSSLPHIIASASPSLSNLCQMAALSS